MIEVQEPIEHDIVAAKRGFLLEESSPGKQKRLKRMEQTEDIAHALLGHTHGMRMADGPIFPSIVHIDGKAVLVDEGTGEVLEAEPGEGLALRCALMHHLQSQEENQWVALVQGHKKDGAFEIPREYNGAFYRHSSRLNPDHMASQRARTKAKAREAVARAKQALTSMERVAMSKGWRHRLSWSMLTLTMPPHPSATSEREVKRVNIAFRLFAKRLEFKKHVRAGIKAVENELSEKGPHVHIHTLILGTYWRFEDIRDIWFDCLDQATMREYGTRLDKADLEARGVEGGVIIDIRNVKNKPNPKDKSEMGMMAALEEVCKYITTPSALSSVSSEVLLEIELVERWGRMFEILGTARQRKALGPEATSLDTTCISGGGLDAPPRADGCLFPDLIPEKDYLSEEDSDFATKWVHEPDEKAPRPPSWRDLMYSLSLSEWVNVMLERVAKARHYMGKKLKSLYLGDFFTLEGRDVAFA